MMSRPVCQALIAFAAFTVLTPLLALTLLVPFDIALFDQHLLASVREKGIAVVLALVYFHVGVSSMAGGYAVLMGMLRPKYRSWLLVLTAITIVHVGLWFSSSGFDISSWTTFLFVMAFLLPAAIVARWFVLKLIPSSVEFGSGVS